MNASDNRKRLQILNGACLAAMVATVGFFTWSRFLFVSPPLLTPDRMNDYSINVGLTRSLCDSGYYPPNFAYPLPAALLFRAVDSLGFSLGALAWLVVLSASLIGCLLLSERLITGGGGRYAGIIIALGFAGVYSYPIWDLCATNINSIYLLLVLLAAWCWQKERPTLAGVLFAASVPVKVYSIVLLPYLIARKQWRMAGAMVVSLVILFVVLPVLYFGWHHALALSRSWMNVIATTSRPDFCLTLPAYKVSLSWTALLLMNPAASEGFDHAFNWFNWSTAAVGWAVKLVCLAWGLLVAAYFFRALRAGSDRKQEKLALMLDISVLLFCAFPASSFLQPHHLAVMVVPAICLVHVAFDPEFKPRSRSVAGLTVGLGLCLTRFGPANPLRGVGVMAMLAVYLLGIWLTRRACRPARRAVPAETATR